ncbi:hypothetical protein ZOSMA_64G00640 [Zostera marina]|uniref:Uncharacterized protein n=1 Tax=Zostera marina TaxID=29655 RepID=A0A0K9NUW1_ZOSMR|nr:hypothetical protein ZOSMA_64G00640 [Zostera marina]
MVNNLIMDNDRLILSGNVYQTWLQDTRKRRRKFKQPNPILAGKIANIMKNLRYTKAMCQNIISTLI